MIAARRRALIVMLSIAALASAGWLFAARMSEPVRKPQLLLLTSLPLLFGEGFDPNASGSPALTALSEKFEVRPISTTSALELARGNLLLMAQPPPQSPDNLVALDSWVRGGGHLLLLADPLLEWPSRYPLGNALRPPVMFTDTGLLTHWGLRLDAPDERGSVSVSGGHEPIVLISPGRLAALNSDCQLSRAGIVADCQIGKGRAVVIADADVLNAGSRADDDTQNGLAWIVHEVTRLSVIDSQRTGLSTGATPRTK